MKLLSFLIALILPSISCGQSTYTLGEQEFTQEEEEKTVFTAYNPQNFPALKDSIDLAYLMPPAGDQGSKGSCWAWATTYALRSVMDNNQNYFSDGRLNLNLVYSPEYVYQLYKGDKSDCSWGAYSFAMLENILKDGAVKFADFPYDAKVCNKQPNSQLKYKAKQFAKKGYIVDKLNDLFSMQKILSDNQPLILSIKVDDFFCKQGNITSASPFWKAFYTRKGSHAMVVVGYNNRLQALKVLNSWGQDFGDKGYVWISYSIINSAMNYSCYPKKALENLPITTSSVREEGQVVSPNMLDSTLSTWFKEGYYRPYGDLKIVLSKLDKEKKFAVIEVRNKNYNLITNFYVDLKSSKEFYVSSRKYEFTFDNIAKAGRNPLNEAAYFTIKQLSLR